MHRLHRVAKRVMANAGNLGIRKTSSQANFSATFEKLKNASPFLLPAAAGMLAYFFANYPATKSILQDMGALEKLSEFLASRIKGTIPYTAHYSELLNDKEYISRASIEAEILVHISEKKASGIYKIIYGGKGVGKSTLVDAVIHGRPGILKVQISAAGCKEDLLRQIADATGTSKFNPTVKDFTEALRKAVSGEGILPTVIFEVETAGGKEETLGIHAVRSLSKEFASVCNCIIIVSEANTVVEFGKDPGRETFVFVDELNENELREFVKQKGLILNETEIKKLNDNIGSNPATLNKLREHMRRGLSLDDFITMTLRGAENELVAFQHQQILKALKDHPEGISPAFFNKLKSEGVDLSDPMAVGAAMRRGNVITYRIELGKYMIYSKATEVALRGYDPILPAVMESTNTMEINELKKAVAALTKGKI